MKWKTRIPTLAIWVAFLVTLSGVVSTTVQPVGVTGVLTQQEQYSLGNITSRGSQPPLPSLPVVGSFPAPTYPRGLEYAEGYLYYAQSAAEDYIVKVDLETGKEVTRYDWTLSDFPIGIAWDGENFYVSDDTTRKEFAEGKEFIHKVDRNFKPVKRFPPPAPWLRDMAYDGASLFVPSSHYEGEEFKGGIYVLNPKDGSIKEHFPTPHSPLTPMNSPEGLAWDGEYFWLANADFLGDEDYIYKLNPRTKPWSVVEQYKAPGPYPTGLAFDGQYLWVVDWGEEKLYQLDIGFFPKCPPDSIALKPNEFMLGQKIGPKALTEAKKDQYCILVAPESKLLAIKLDSKKGGNLDMHIRRGKPVERVGKIIIADFSLLSPSGSEFIIIFSPQLKAGPYFIAVENKEDSEQEFTIIATPIANIQAIKAREPVDGQIDPNAGLLPFLRQYLETRAGLLGLTQYKFVVPKEAKSIKIQLFGPRDKNLDLHLRYGKPVEIRPDGSLEADLSLPGPIGEEAVVISGAFLKPETLYIAVESLEKDKQSFKILVTVDTGGGLQTFIFQ